MNLKEIMFSSAKTQLAYQRQTQNIPTSVVIGRTSATTSESTAEKTHHRASVEIHQTGGEIPNSSDDGGPLSEIIPPSSETIEIDYHEYMLLKYQSYQFAFIFAKQQEQLQELNKLAAKNHLLKMNNKLLKKRLRKKGVEVSTTIDVVVDDEDRHKEDENTMMIEPATTLEETKQHDSENTQSIPIQRAQSQPCIFTSTTTTTPHDEDEKDKMNQIKQESNYNPSDESESKEGLINLVISLTLELAMARGQIDEKDLCLSKIQEEKNELLVKHQTQNTHDHHHSRSFFSDMNNQENNCSRNRVRGRMNMFLSRTRSQSYDAGAPRTYKRSSMPYLMMTGQTTKKMMCEKKEKILIKTNDWAVAAKNNVSSRVEMMNHRRRSSSMDRGTCHNANSVRGVFRSLDEEQKRIMGKRFSSIF